MEKSPPLTAKEAALRGAQADRPLFNPQADKRHVIASAMRLAGEAIGQSEETDGDANQIDDGSALVADAESLGVSGGPDELTQTPANWAASADSPTTRDLSLAEMIGADQAAAQDLSSPMATLDDDGQSASDFSIDALQSSIWTLDDSKKNELFAPSSEFPELAQVIDQVMPPDTSPNSAPFSMPFGIPGEFPLIQDPRSSAPAIGPFNPSPLAAPSRSNVSDLVYRYDTTDSGGISQLPHNPADEPAGPKVQLLASGADFIAVSPANEVDAPVTYLPFGESASGPNAAGTPVEKLPIGFESTMGDVKRDSVLAFIAMEPAFIKLVERMGEQDRRDALALAASRRACLGR
jgi:hypothetical protein